MSKPSQFILQGILQVMQSKSITTQALANSLKQPKREIKRVLAGKTPLTVDMLSEIGAVLELEDSDLQQFMGVSIPEDAKPPFEVIDNSESITLHTVDEIEEDDWTPNPIGNHPMQLIKLGFAIGCDMFLLMITEQLDQSGIPDAVRQQFRDRMPIRLDSAYFQHYRPEFYDDYLEIRLSFDAVYTCYIPWHALEQVTFFVNEDEPSESSEDSEDSSDAPSKPILQIID